MKPALLACALLAVSVACGRPSDVALGGEASSPSASTGLAGTSWQLVKFQGGDGAKDRHLYLSLMADGGIYELEPAPPRQPTP